jgi:hypothetical protein
MKTLKLLCLLLPLSILACNKDCQENTNSNVVCTEQYDPICGCNDKTYGNACLAGAAGITSFTKGECEKKADCKELDFPPQYPCTAQYDPVCGCNKKTYPNSCEAERVGIKTYTKGECVK